MGLCNQVSKVIRGEGFDLTLASVNTVNTSIHENVRKQYWSKSLHPLAKHQEGQQTSRPKGRHSVYQRKTVINSGT